jgi:hypothetical protein
MSWFEYPIWLNAARHIVSAVGGMACYSLA